MRLIYAFEFMDLEGLWPSLRDCTRDLLRMCNGEPFRFYNRWVVRNIASMGRDLNLGTMVELGAGTAPVTRGLLQRLEGQPFKTLMPTDYYPDQAVFSKLAENQLVSPVLEQVDYSKPLKIPANALVVLSATFHHIRPEDRLETLRNMSESAARVAIYEGLRRNKWSLLLCLLSPITSLLAPLFLIGKPGRLRRFFWCWLVPIAPIIFLFDGWVSCLRAWTADEWQDALEELGYDAKVEETLFCQGVSWTSHSKKVT